MKNDGLCWFTRCFPRALRLTRAIFVPALVPGLVCGAARASAAEDGPAPGDPVVRIAVIGGSSAADYDPAETDMRGWGMMLRAHLAPGHAEIINAARGGRSSKSFLREGRWEAVLAHRPAPDYVLICFGPNDVGGKGEHRETLPGPAPEVLPEEGLGSRRDDWFRNNLRRYITEARAADIVPVIVTPQERSTFRADGTVVRRNAPWSQAAVAVAEEEGVVLVDLNAFSIGLLERIGPEESVRMQFIRADGSVDRSHHNATGAGLFAGFIAAELVRSIPELQAVIKDTGGSTLAAFLEEVSQTPAP